MCWGSREDVFFRLKKTDTSCIVEREGRYAITRVRARKESTKKKIDRHTYRSRAGQANRYDGGRKKEKEVVSQGTGQGRLLCRGFKGSK